MPVGALIGASLIGGVASARSASKAADAQAAAAGQANDTQRYIFDRSVGLSEPQRITGLNALAAMRGMTGIGEMPSFGASGNLLNIAQADDGGYEVRNIYGNTVGDFNNLAGAQEMMDRNRFSPAQDPGYQFRQSEAQKAMERSAAARGLRLSGGTLRAIGDYTSGLASQEFGNSYNRLASLAGVGQAATSQQVGLGQNYANSVGQNALAAGNARASGYLGQANALNNTLGDVSGLYMMNQLGAFG